MSDGPQNSPIEDSASTRERLVELLRTHDLSPVFQPIVSLQTGEIAGFEALTRPGKATGFKGPMELFAAASEHGLMWELEDLARGTILQRAADFPDGVTLFLNNSPEVFADTRFPARFEEQVFQYPELTPSRIVMEVTEHAEDRSFARLAEHVRTLKDRGYQIAIDDVGAGASGLNRVMMLRPHWLKLDRALVQDIDRDPYKLNLIRFLMHFANLSGVSVIAEGIERRDELSAVIGMGVRYGQGFVLAKPNAAYQLVPDDIKQFVRRCAQEAAGARPRDPGGTRLENLCQAAELAQALSPVSHVAASLVRDQGCPGLVVMDGRRCVGWCSRDTVLSIAKTDSAAEPIGFFTRSSASTLPPDASLRQALELVSVRDDPDLTAPIVVATNERVLGVVSLRTLLSAAASDSRFWGQRLMPLTGLPGRLAADLHIGELIHSATQGRGGAETSAAIIDFRSFADFNGTFGYELGDRLIQELTAHLRDRVLPLVPDGFLAHLGEDRFILFGRSVELEAASRRLIEHADEAGFESAPALSSLHATPSAEGTQPPPEPAASVAARAPVGVRVLLIPQLASRLTEPRQLYQIEQQLRRVARQQESSLDRGKSHFVRDERGVGRRRLSA